ncbi:MAG: L,D-transpeptidase family protein [Sphingomicrobium sp.]
MKRAAVAGAAILLLSGSFLAWYFAAPTAPSPRARTTTPAALRGDRIAVAPGPDAIRSVLNIRAPMRYGDFVWNDREIPAGPVWVRVDLHDQILSVFRAGHEIGTAVILYGADAKPTPVGSFPVLAKLKDHRSAPYDAPMPYTLRLTPDGVSIHGSNVRWGAATHGCIGVPTAFAAKLFEQVPIGGRVTVVGADAPRRPDRLPSASRIYVRGLTLC